MTRPIYEPTSQRQIRRQGFTGDQLLRRPRLPTGAGGDQPWIRLIFEGPSDQTIGAPGNAAVLFNTIRDSEAGTTFGTASVGGGTDNAVTILEDGIYAFTYRLYMTSVNTNTGYSTEMNGIDYDELLYYERFQSPIATGLSAHDSYIFRSGPDYGAEPPELYVVVRNPATANANIVIKSDFATGTYMEIIRLNSAVVGDPDIP